MMLAAVDPSAAPGVPGASDFINSVNQAEKASDRWLFLAAFIIILIFCSLVIRYLVKDRETARTEHSVQLKDAYGQAETSRKEHAMALKEMYGEQTKLSAQLLVALQENNLLIARMEKLLERLESHKT